MMVAYFHSQGTTPSFNDKLNSLACGILTCATVSISSLRITQELRLVRATHIRHIYHYSSLSVICIPTTSRPPTMFWMKEICLSVLFCSVDSTCDS